MLVLSRKKGESVVINSDIRVTVIEVRGGKVRLGFIAPGGVKIFREELLHRAGGAASDPPSNFDSDARLTRDG